MAKRAVHASRSDMYSLTKARAWSEERISNSQRSFAFCDMASLLELSAPAKPTRKPSPKRPQNASHQLKLLQFHTYIAFLRIKLTCMSLFEPCLKSLLFSFHFHAIPISLWDSRISTSSLLMPGVSIGHAPLLKDLYMQNVEMYENKIRCLGSTLVFERLVKKAVFFIVHNIPPRFYAPIMLAATTEPPYMRRWCIFFCDAKVSMRAG
jgi:hypothetical protein